jgi:hypothetical protein
MNWIPHPTTAKANIMGSNAGEDKRDMPFFPFLFSSEQKGH